MMSIASPQPIARRPEVATPPAPLRIGDAMRHALRAPALHWTDGHVLGNGDVGAVVWGTPNHFCVGLSKHDINDLRCASPHGARLKHPYPEARDRVMAGARNVRQMFEGVDSAPADSQQQLSCGCLRLELMRTVQPHAFEQTLDFERAEVVALVEPTCAGWTWGQRYRPVTARVCVLRDRNAVSIQLDSAAEQEIAWSFDHAPSARDAEVNYEVDASGLACSTWRFAQCSRFTTAIHGATDASADRFGVRGRVRFGGKRGACRLILSIATGDDASQIATEVATNFASIEAAHHRFWRAFWQRSTVQTDVEWLDTTYRMAQFALGAATRPDTSPPNLQGIWCQDDVSPWHADFHFNTNLQACHWMACSSNRPELQAAFVRALTVDWRDEFREIARTVYGSEGVAVPIASDIKGRTLSAWGFAEIGMTAWIAQHVWEQFTFTQDLILLREFVYPFLRECAMLYRSILVRDEKGIYNVELTHSPEQNCIGDDGKEIALYGRNAAIDISVIGALMSALNKAANLLGETPDALLLACDDIRTHLPPLPTHNGVLIDYETAFFKQGDGVGQLKVSHRHPSRLMPIFPQRQIDLGSDAAALALGRRSFDEFHRAYGNAGFTGWSYAYQACIAARLGLADDARDCLRALHDHFTLRGGLTSHNSLTPGFANHAELGGELFQIEALLAAAAAINEMLLQRTSDDVIRVFPAWPLGKAARFERLCVPGAVCMSAAHDGSRVLAIEIVSRIDAPLTLQNPWPGGAVLRDELGTQTPHAGGLIHWTAKAGMTYRFESL